MDCTVENQRGIKIGFVRKKKAFKEGGADGNEGNGGKLDLLKIC